MGDDLADQHFYEKKQNYNALTRLFHGTRYRNLLKIFEGLEGQIRVIDIGAGTGKAFEVLNEHYDIDYVGIEMRDDFTEIAEQRYGHHGNFSMVCDVIQNQFDLLEGADVIIALETMEHIPEGLVVRVIEEIAKSGPKKCYITVPNEVGPAIAIKNVGSALMGYSRWKEYRWSETFWASVYNLERVGLHGTGHKGFDYRWLAQTIRHNMEIKRWTKSPFQWVPRSISPSIGFVAEPRSETPADDNG